MNSLKGKRLLLLGGGSWGTAIKAFADANGITLIATGNDPHGGIFDIADESCHVDSTDVDAMKWLIREKDIDGVYLGGSEKVLSCACQYVNELGYPCYCTKEQWDAFENKLRFKSLLMKYGLPCARLYSLDSDELLYPLVTKPADGSGGEGFSVCRNREELLKGYEAARQASRSGTAMIEQFVRNESVKVFYAFTDGDPHFLLLCDKSTHKYTAPESYVVTDYIFPSKHTDTFRKRYEATLFSMFRDTGISNGTLWMEVFRDGDDYCFNEAGFRYMGNTSVYPVDYFTGINQVASDITFALTGHSQLYGHEALIRKDVPQKNYYSMHYVHLSDGRIADIEGVEAFRQSTPECVYLSVMKEVGDEIKNPHTIAQCFASVHFVFDTFEELELLVVKMHETIHVTDTNGQEMLVKREPLRVKNE